MARLPAILLALCAGSALVHAVPASAAGVRVAVGDLNSDGQQDLVSVDDGGDVNVILCNADGSFAVTTYTPGDLVAPSSIAIADVNGDGRPDVIVTDANDAGSGVHVFLNNGDGTLAPEAVYASGAAGAAGPTAVAVADVNGGGRPEILTADGVAGTVSVLPGNGDGSFGAPRHYPAGTNMVALAVADLNGDGWPDVVSVDQAGDSVVVLLNDGQGGFAAPVAQTVGNAPVSVALADLNADGIVDMAVANQGDDTISVLLGNGDGTFAAPVSYATGSLPSWITVEDIYGDGLPDIVTDNYSDGSVSLFANTGGGGFAPQVQVFPAYGSDNTVVMSVASNAPAVVSVDLQVSSVVVTAPAAPTVTTVKPPKGPPKAGVYRVSGSKASSETGKGGLDGLTLLLLGALLSQRRRSRDSG